MSIMIPMMSTTIVEREHPFHSFKIMPHTFENTTLRAMRIQNDNVYIEESSGIKPFPIARPKNWLYHNMPANAQNIKFEGQTEILP